MSPAAHVAHVASLCTIRGLRAAGERYAADPTGLARLALYASAAAIYSYSDRPRDREECLDVCAALDAVAAGATVWTILSVEDYDALAGRNIRTEMSRELLALSADDAASEWSKEDSGTVLRLSGPDGVEQRECDRSPWMPESGMTEDAAHQYERDEAARRRLADVFADARLAAATRIGGAA